MRKPRGPAVVAVVAVVAVIGVGAPPAADACTCDSRTADEEDAWGMRAADIVFDGWVIGRDPLAGTCPMPPAPPPKRGCLRIRIHQRPDCTPMTFPTPVLEPATGGDALRVIETTDDGVSELCGLKKGRYVLTAALQRWLVDPDGTPEHGIVIDFDPATPQSYSAIALPGGAWVVLPVTVHKGTVSGRELAASATTCGGGLRPFKAYRFAFARDPDGVLRLFGCNSGTRELSDDEIATMVRPPPPPPPSAPPPAAPPTPAKRSDGGGCLSSSRSSEGLAMLAVVLALGLAARRSRRAHPKAR